MKSQPVLRNILPVFSLVLGVVWGGCTITKTVYLQDLAVSGPINQPPVHVTSKPAAGEFRITPRLTLNNSQELTGRIEGHSPVSASGYYRVDTIFSGGEITGFQEHQGVNNIPFKGNNFSWKMPKYTIGADIDYMLSGGVAFSFGMSYSSVNQEGFFGGNAGLGFPFQGKSASLRIEGGVQWQTLSYEAYSVVATTSTSFFSSSSTTDVMFFRDRGKITPVNLYGSLTLNTNNDNWPVNLFGHVTVCKQTLADFKPVEEYVPFPFLFENYQDARVQNSTTFLILTPGIFIDFNGSSRLLIGLRCATATDIYDSSKEWTLMPLLQLDVNL